MRSRIQGAPAVSANVVETAILALTGAPPARSSTSSRTEFDLRPAARRLRELRVPFLGHSGDPARQGRFVARLGAGAIAKPAARIHAARCDLSPTPRRERGSTT
jgi:hypothetical protein